MDATRKIWATRSAPRWILLLACTGLALAGAEGSQTEVRNNPEVRKAYLGDSDFKVRGRASGWQAGEERVLDVAGLTAGYGAAPVLTDIELGVRDGEMVAVLGANGAG